MTFQIGEVINDYQILGVLGSGGMGRVFRVRNLISERIEAMKIVLPDAAAESDLAERFMREIKVHATMEHPHIAAMRTAFRVQDRIVMIIELIGGANVAELLQHGPLELPEALSYAAQTLSALEYAHARGVVHRDVKPANIIATPAGTVKVTDFGIARAGGGNQRLTATGMALGSLPYMSPEQIRGGIPDARSDIYSVGVTLYEMVTGVQPIRGENEYAIMHAHLTEEPVPPSRLIPSLSADLEGVILKALAKAPEHRFQSAAEFRSALGVTAEVPRVPPREHPPAPLNPGPLHPDEVVRVENYLTRVVGPISRHMVSKAMKSAASIDDLCRQLAEQVPEMKERESFLRLCGKSGETAAPAKTPGASRPRANSQSSLNPGMLEEAQRKLARFMGPIARILVDRMARKARTAEEFYSMLAAEIPSESDRASFLSSKPG